MSKFMLSSAAATSHNRYLLHIVNEGKPKCGRRIVLAVYVDKVIYDEPRLGLCRQCGTDDDFYAIEHDIATQFEKRVKYVYGIRTWNGIVSLQALMKVYNEAKNKHFWDEGMLKHALSIAMNKSTHKEDRHWCTKGHEKPWQHFDVNACSCKGSIRNPVCKHKVAAWLLDNAIREETSVI